MSRRKWEPGVWTPERAHQQATDKTKLVNPDAPEPDIDIAKALEGLATIAETLKTAWDKVALQTVATVDQFKPVFDTSGGIVSGSVTFQIPAYELIPSWYGPSILSELRPLLPGLSERIACPACPQNITSLDNVIVCLNDRHRWTREQIADWLDGLDVDLRFPTPVDA